MRELSPLIDRRPWLVTGARGFLGRWIVDFLRRSGRLAVGLSRIAQVSGGWITGDLGEPGSIERVLATLEPSVVIHCAGKTPPASQEAFTSANMTCTANLVAALEAWGEPVRLVAAGSASELGPVAEADLPANEDIVPQPVDGYGRSKLKATETVIQARSPVEGIVGRVFNPIGPGLPSSQAFGRFAAELRRPGVDPLDLEVGDVTAKRDFVDVRDAAAALVLLAERGRPGAIYHIGTGESRTVSDGLNRLIALSGRDVRIRENPDLARPGPLDSRADSRRLCADTGWSPTVPFERSLADLFLHEEEQSAPGDEAR